MIVSSYSLKARLLTKRNWLNMSRCIEKTICKGAKECVFRGAVARFVPELCANLSKIVALDEIWPLMTSGDLSFDLT